MNRGRRREGGSSIMSESKWKLLEPFRIGTLCLKNRIVMPPMECLLNGADGSVNQAIIDYYEEAARGGVGTIIVQNSYIDEKASRSALVHLGVYSDHLIAGIGDLAETIKSYGVAALLQISHGGRQANPAANPYCPPIRSCIKPDPCGAASLAAPVKSLPAGLANNPFA